MHHEGKRESEDFRKKTMEDDAHEFLENHSILKVARSTCEEGTPMQRIFQPLTIEMALPQPR